MKKEEIKIKIFYKLSEELKDKWHNFEKRVIFHFFQKYDFVEDFFYTSEVGIVFL